jgi:tRNA(Ile)-lysidine synthase
MNIQLQPGRYVVAVSGGVDSVVLLDLLHKMPDMQLVVAHYDHGIRPDSDVDRRLVGQLARTYGVPFVYDEGNLGPATSEATARKARYDFLHTVIKQINANSIVTAHHQDDVVETALLQLLRGTGRKGMSSLKSTDIIKRPLLHIPKRELQLYAIEHNLVWREDSTNKDTKYKRNYVRKHLVPKLTTEQKQQLLQIITEMRELNLKLDEEFANLLHVQPSTHEIYRRYFALLPHDIAAEFMAVWLRKSGIKGFDRKGLHRLVVAAKTFAPGQRIDVNHTYFIDVQTEYLALKRRDR